MDKLAQLGIDPWSMLLYLVNTGLLIFILFKILYKPVMDFIDKRQTEIKNEIEQAKKLQEEFENKLQKIQKEKEQSEQQMQEELKKLKEFTEKKRLELVSEMEAKRAEMIRKTEEEISSKKAGILKEAEAEVKTLMQKIILQIVENNVPEEVVQKSISSGWKTYTSK